MTYWLVNIGMTMSVVSFTVGFYFRKQTGKHRIWMSLGILFNLVTAIGLVVSVHLFHGGDFVAAGFYPVVPPWAILCHRILATLTVLLMLAQAFTGIIRNRKWHLRIQRLFVPLYLIIYVSGLLIFTNHPG